MKTHVASGCSLNTLPLFCALTVSTPVFAVDFNIGEIEGRFDSSLSIGSSWALRNPDPHLIGVNNGGKGSASTGDDGRLNFKKHETFSKIFKGVHDLELKYQDVGVFVRGKYWYDFELKDENRRFRNIDDDGRKEGAKSSGAQILDAFAYYNYVISDLPGSFRAGKQVVNWGESTFIPGGINVINPIDVAAIRRPGSEVKEALLPVNMFYLSQALTDNLGLETFYQLDWEQTVVDNCGTFFGSDILADGCNFATVGPNLTGNASAVRGLTPFGVGLDKQGIILPRGDDRDARNGGQWGAAMRYMFEPLDTEFGAYFVNYHSRSPYLSSQTSAHATDLGFAPQLCANLGIAANSAGCGSAVAGLAPAYRFGTANYFIEYPEDIQMYGLSFATTLPTGTALSGEISYRPNLPLQLNTVDLLQATIGATAQSPILSSGDMLIGNSTDMTGYKRKEVTQMQVTAVHFVDQVLGASRLSLVGEVGAVYVAGLEGNGGVRYGRDNVYGLGAISPDNSKCSNAQTRFCTNDGFVTTTSWGYRGRASLDYPSAIAGINLQPSVSWSHDVKGYAPSQSAGFNEGSKAISLGLTADYKNTYTATLNYTDFFGGTYNSQIDRDFVALSMGVNF
ncbi:DUF1302 domain-containing protein [Pseudomonas nunensis]|uniref:DUF1302 domain-containing protein n=1 Tax=Pseudomonas nunensis TaxID=2961896 RepID=UPI0006B55E2E|nr:DUF1302 domain-containing protein [Pseudomonas nunensis]KOY00761.1 adhesin [Pseudomonas nunensis]